MKKLMIVSAAVLLAGCNTSPEPSLLAQDTAQQGIIEAQHMKSLLEYAGDKVDEVVLIANDHRTGYSTNNIVKKINFGTLQSDGRFVKFSNGNILRVEAQVRNDSTLTSQELTCEPAVQLRTNKVYTGIKSKIKLTSAVTGVDDTKEATYAYIGLYTSGIIGEGGRTEAGFFMQNSRNYVPNVYHAYAKVGATATHTEYWFDATYDISNTGLGSGILKGTNVRVSQKVLKTTTSLGGTEYKLATIWEILDSNGVNTVKSFSYVYPQTGSYFSSAAMNNLAGGRTTSYLADTISSGDGVLDQHWYDTRSLTAYYMDGNIRSPYSYTETLVTPNQTSMYSYHDAQNCFNNGPFAKSVLVINPNYEAKESIYVP